MSSIIKGISAIGTAFNLYAMFKKMKGVSDFEGEYTKVIDKSRRYKGKSAYEAAWGKPPSDWQKQLEQKGKDALEAARTREVKPAISLPEKTHSTMEAETSTATPPPTWRQQLGTKVSNWKTQLQGDNKPLGAAEVGTQSNKPPLTTSVDALGHKKALIE